MKTCPTCEKTFDDNLRFCQADGTPLVEAEEELDPFKTMLGRPGDFAAAIPKDRESSPADADVLELPEEHDANKTQVVSAEELRAEMEKADAAESEIVELPPINDSAPEPPRFNEPSVEPPPSAFSGTPQPPSSPFASDPPRQDAPSPFSGNLMGDHFAHTTPPIPSPFGNPRDATPEPHAPQFAEPDSPKLNEPSLNPFEQSASKEEQQMEPAQWNPPAAPDANWQGQQIGGNTPFQPPAAGTEGQSKTLSLVSLVLGILSIPCCGFISGVPAVIVGMMARGRVKKDPQNYTGSGLAMAGIITGIIGTILSITLGILQFMYFGTQGVFGNF